MHTEKPCCVTYRGMLTDQEEGVEEEEEEEEEEEDESRERVKDRQ